MVADLSCYILAIDMFLYLFRGFFLSVAFVYSMLFIILIVGSEGSARMTLFAANGNARTFDYEVRAHLIIGPSLS